MARQFMSVYTIKCDKLSGKLLLCSDGVHLTRLEFMDSRELRDLRIDSGVDLRESKLDSSVILGESKVDFMESQGDLCDCGADSSDLPIFMQTKEWLDLYFSGEIPRFAPRFAFPSGASAFALRVWEILQSIPYGKTTTYGAIAKQIAREFGIAKMSAQAVGSAVSRNPIAIIIPCHRVVGANDNLTGYAGGLENKIALLKIEGIATNRLKMPKNY